MEIYHIGSHSKHSHVARTRAFKTCQAACRLSVFWCVFGRQTCRVFGGENVAKRPGTPASRRMNRIWEPPETTSASTSRSHFSFDEETLRCGLRVQRFRPVRPYAPRTLRAMALAFAVTGPTAPTRAELTQGLPAERPAEWKTSATWVCRSWVSGCGCMSHGMDTSSWHLEPLRLLISWSCWRRG